MVLDVEQFINQHPGGRFVLLHNIGRDVSKFFHGGYSLEGNMGRTPAQGYMHSSLARMVVNDLAISTYSPETEVTSATCRVIEDECIEVNPSTKTIVFETQNGQAVPNFKAHFHSLNFAAKHFLIRNLAESNGVARHYTICNAMRP